MDRKAQRENPFSSAQSGVAEMNRRALAYTCGLQTVLFEELLAMNSDALKTVQAETEVMGELASRFASAHSVKDFADLCHDYQKHQRDIIRLNGERIMAHGVQMFEKALLFQCQSKQPEV